MENHYEKQGQIMLETYMYKMIELLADVVEANIVILFVGIFTIRGRIEKRWKQMLGFAVVMGGICFLVDQVDLISWWKTSVMLVLYILICDKLYKVNIQKIIFLVVSYAAFAIIFELIIIFIIHYITGMEVAVFMEMGLERAAAIIITKILEIFVMCSMYRISAGKTMTTISKKIISVVIGICLTVTFMTVFFVSHYIMGTYVEISVLFYLIVSLCVVLFVMYFMFVTASNMDREQNLEMIQIQNMVLQKSLEETKNSYTYWEQRVHDYKNVMLCLDGMLENRDYIAVCEYLKKEIRQIQKGHHLVNSGNVLVDSILNAKWLVADNNQIFFSIQGKLYHQLPIPEIPFGRLMGNLIDNAIEGTEGAKQRPYVEVVLCQTEWMLSLEVSNSSTEKRIDFHKSSKKEKSLHGIGLNSVKEIIKEYDGFFEIRQIKDRVVAKVELFVEEDFA
jgi:sensor histidine kinase YesM